MYMWPSRHCAVESPFLAAYSSEVMFAVRADSPGCSGVAGEGSDWSCGRLVVPSKASSGASPMARPISTIPSVRSHIRIARLLGRSARMGDGTVERRPDLLGVLPQITRGELSLPWLPILVPPLQLLCGELHIQRAFFRVDLDDVAVAQEPDRPADCRLRPDMADAEAARRAGEAPVGDERDLAVGALAVERGGRGKHLAHPGTAARPLVPDHQHVAFAVLACRDRREARLFAVEAARRAGELQVFHPGDLHDRALRREVALQPDDTTGRGKRVIGPPHHVLLVVPAHAAQVFRDGAPGHGHAVAVEMTGVEQALHELRHAAGFEP